MAKPTTVSLSSGDVQASAKIGKISVNSETQANFVHAKLTLDSKTRKLKSANLNCFTLIINGTTSDEINVDSIASVLANPYPADANGRIQVSVYWVYSAQKPIDAGSLSSARLGIRSDTSSCFQY